MQEIGEYAEKVGVKLALEFLNRFEIYLLTCAGDLARFIDAVDCSAVGGMYDTFHAHIEEKDVMEAIHRLASGLWHVHISENDRSTPGLGAVRWAETFDALKAIKYDGWMVIEAFGLALAELVAATKIWRRMYENEEQLAAEGLAFMKQHVGQRWVENPV